MDASAGETNAGGTRNTQWQGEHSGGTASRAAQDSLRRVEELAGLYRELQEAGDGELAKTESGRQQLKDREALAVELRALHERMARGETPFYEAREISQDLRNGFREKYHREYLDAYGQHVRLQPSVEAVAYVLHPHLAAGMAWVSETAYLEALALQPKPVSPDTTSTAQQGLGDPNPWAFRFCLTPPYPVVQTDPDVMAVTLLNKISNFASPSGGLSVFARAGSADGIGDSELNAGARRRHGRFSCQRQDLPSGNHL